MENKNKKARTIFVILFTLSALIFVGVISQAKSIAILVDENYNQPTVSKAFSACEADRVKFISKGQDCEPCYLSCPYSVTQDSDGTYSFSYQPQSTYYKGTYSNLECDRIGDDPGRLLQVKSYCNDAIRLCEEQDGTGIVVSQERTDHGTIKYISYRVWITDCDSGDHLGDSYATKKYRLYCDDGYAVNGIKISEYKGSLGYCQAINQENRPTDDPILSGVISQITFDERAGFDEEIRIRGTFVPDVDGRYYVYARLKESQRTPLSIVKGFGVQDLCGNDLNIAGTFLDVKRGDTAIFELSLPSPNVEGNYPIEVAVRDGCYGDDFEIKEGSTRVLSEEGLADEVIDTVVTDDPEDVDDKIDETVDDLNDIINIEDCTGSEDLTIDGCQVAECIDGQIFLLSDNEIESRCGDSDVADVINKAKDNTGKNEEYNPDFVFDPGTKVGKILIVSGAVMILMFMAMMMLFMPRRR